MTSPEDTQDVSTMIRSMQQQFQRFNVVFDEIRDKLELQDVAIQELRNQGGNAPVREGGYGHYAYDCPNKRTMVMKPTGEIQSESDEEQMTQPPPAPPQPPTLTLSDLSSPRAVGVSSGCDEQLRFLSPAGSPSLRLRNGCKLRLLSTYCKYELPYNSDDLMSLVELVGDQLFGNSMVAKSEAAAAGEEEGLLPELLVDWTLGKNIILTSDAPSVTEFRGPYDVVNLVSLLGLSLEHAKAALSKNCWDLEPKLLDAAPDSGLR
nr:uncharacterized protein LOC109172840 isoform X4 [Ipomoea batatas]